MSHKFPIGFHSISTPKFNTLQFRRVYHYLNEVFPNSYETYEEILNVKKIP